MSRNAIITEKRELENTDRLAQYEKSDEEIKSREAKRPWQHSLAFAVVSTIIVVFAGAAVYTVTGLSGALDSTLGQAVLGIGIVFTFLVCFRRGLHSG